MMISRRLWRKNRNTYVCSLCNHGSRSIRYPVSLICARRWASDSPSSSSPPLPPKPSGWGSPSFIPRAPPKTSTSDGLSEAEVAARQALLGPSGDTGPKKQDSSKAPSSSAARGLQGATSTRPAQASRTPPTRPEALDSNTRPHKVNWSGPDSRSRAADGSGDNGGQKAWRDSAPSFGARPPRSNRRDVTPSWAPRDKDQQSPQMSSPKSGKNEDFWDHFGYSTPTSSRGRNTGQSDRDVPTWALPKRTRKSEDPPPFGGAQTASPSGSRPSRPRPAPEPDTSGMQRFMDFANSAEPKTRNSKANNTQPEEDWAKKFTRPTTGSAVAGTATGTAWTRPGSVKSRVQDNAPSWGSRQSPSSREESGAAAAASSWGSRQSPSSREESGAAASASSWGSRQPHSMREDTRYAAKSKRSRGGMRTSREIDRDDEEYNEEVEILAEKRRRQKMEEKAARKAARLAGEQQMTSRTQIFLPEYISVADLARALQTPVGRFISSLEEYGFEEISEDTVFTGESAGLVAQEFGFDVKVDDGLARDIRPQPEPEDPTSVPSRPPVVAIMGHVDHGKTTLLDYIRKSSVVEQEHGGITQHIGAFEVKLASGKSITFLDTPGHAAFLTMRQRGAEVTDIVILVVAADDSVMPQTIEALKHARAAKVPVIVAITKADKESARIDQVKSDLSNNGVEIEDYGGDTQVVAVSGRTGLGMKDLEENIVLLSEILDIRAEPDILAEGWVLEASVKPVGKSATVLVKRGTLRVGDCLVCGTAWAKVRVLRNEAGQEVEEAGPGTPVEVLGWRDQLPNAGDRALQPPDEAKARTAVAYRREMQEREKTQKQIAEEEHQRREAEAKLAEAKAAAGEGGEPEAETAGIATVHFIVRGDVAGSVEAVCSTIMEIGNNEVRPRILRSAAGAIVESDVEYAAVSRSVLVNFNNAIPAHLRSRAEEAGVRILDRNVIYHLADDVKAELSARLPEKVWQRVLGEAEILQVFPINVKGREFKNIAGCKIRNGALKKSDMVRIYRKGKKVFDGKLESLKHGKKDVSEMKKGSECGIGCVDFQELEVGDQIQTYEDVREKRTL